MNRYLFCTALWLIWLTGCANLSATTSSNTATEDAADLMADEDAENIGDEDAENIGNEDAENFGDEDTPLQEEQLLGKAPGGWVQIGGTVTETLKMATFIPKPPPPIAEVSSATASEKSEASEAVEGWTEKITFERLLGTPVADPLEYLEELKKDTSAACSNGAFHPIASGFENGYPSAVALIVCPKQAVTNTGQLTMIKVIQGNIAFYTITRSIRTAPFPPDEKGSPVEPPVEKETIGGFSVFLKAISVCDPTRPDHPCPVAQANN